MSMEETIMTLVVNRAGPQRGLRGAGRGETGTVRGSPEEDAGVGSVGDGGP